MNQEISRREFIATFVPSSTTRWRMVRFVVVLLIVCGAWLVVSFLRNLDLISSLKGVSIVAGFLVLLWIIARLIEATRSSVQRSPVIVQALVAVATKALFVAVLSFGVIRIYQRWERADDMLDTWATMIGMALVIFFDEMEKRKKAANQALQTTPMTRSVYEKTTELGHPQRGV